MQAYEPLQGILNYFKTKKSSNVYSKFKGIY